MADRTIKPDSGNDLVLQNNGGGTKIEIPNSGDIAINGTIGSGTFNGTIGDNAIPVGYVVQTVTQVFTGATQFTPSSTIASHLEKNITITAGNKVILHVSIPVRIYANGLNYAAIKGHVYHKVTSSGTYANIATATGSSPRHIQYYFDETGDLPGGFYRDFHIHLAIAHTPSSGTEQYYRMYFQSDQSTNVTIGIESAGNICDQTMILQEIKT